MPHELENTLLRGNAIILQGTVSITFQPKIMSHSVVPLTGEDKTTLTVWIACSHENNSSISHNKQTVPHLVETKLVTETGGCHSRRPKGPDPWVSWAATCVGLERSSGGESRSASAALCGFPIGRCFPVCRGSRTVPGRSVLWAGLDQTRRIPTSIALGGAWLWPCSRRCQTTRSVHGEFAAHRVRMLTLCLNYADMSVRSSSLHKA